MGSSYRRFLDPPFANRPLEEILTSSPAALRGLSPAGAGKLKDALGVQTIRQLGENDQFERARALLAATGKPRFDPGPAGHWADFFATAPLDAYRAHASRFYTAFAPVFYRGRLDGTARLLVVGEDPSTDETLVQRVFVGRSGQRVQSLLAKMGLARSYVMVNAFLFGVRGSMDASLRALSIEGPIHEFRNQLLDRLVVTNDLEAVLAVGEAAAQALAHWPGHGTLAHEEVVHPNTGEPFLLANWNAKLPLLQARVTPDEGRFRDTKPFVAPLEPIEIPRHDLPFGLPEWLGAGGTRSARVDDRTLQWVGP